MSDEPSDLTARGGPPWLDEAVERMLWRLRKAGAELEADDDLFLIAGPQHAAYPALIVRDRSITGIDVRVYLYLRQQAEGGGAGWSWRGYRKALADLGISRGTFALSLARLRLARWIALARRVRRKDGRWAGNLYLLFDEPQEVEDITKVDGEFLCWLGDVVAGHRDRRVRELAAEIIATIQIRAMRGAENPLRSGRDPLERRLMDQGLLLGGEEERTGFLKPDWRELRLRARASRKAGRGDDFRGGVTPLGDKHVSCQRGGTSGTTAVQATNPGRHDPHQRSDTSGITVKHETYQQGGTTGTTPSSKLEPGSLNDETGTCEPSSKFELGPIGSSSRSCRTTTTTTTGSISKPERSAIRARGRRRNPLAGLRWPRELSSQDRFLVGQVLLTVGEQHRQPVLDALRVRLEAVRRGAEPLRYPPHRYVRALCERVREGTFEPVAGATPVVFDEAAERPPLEGLEGEIRELRSRVASLEQLVESTPSEELQLLLGQQLHEARAKLEALLRRRQEASGEATEGTDDETDGDGDGGPAGPAR